MENVLAAIKEPDCRCYLNITAFFETYLTDMVGRRKV